MSAKRLKIEDLAIDLISRNGAGNMVRDVNLVLEPAQPLTLIGETGCGKTLIAQAVLGLLPPEMRARGRIEYRGLNLLDLSRSEMRRLWGRDIFLFPQEPTLALNPTMRAFAQVREVFDWIRGRNGRDSSKSSALALELAGLTARSDWRKYPCQLSGGMRQRLAAAITASEPAELIIADEPTKGLDPQRRGQVVSLLKRLIAQGKALLTITHDLEAARALGGRAAVMYGGRIMEQGATADVLARPRHPYTRALLEASPAAGLKPIPLNVHDRTIDGGCVFAPRCRQALEICFEEEPEGGGSHEECRCHGR